MAPAAPEEPPESNPGEPEPRRRTRRRASTKAVPGSDPTPQKEPPRHSENENDERLKRDTPPHWGYRF